MCPGDTARVTGEGRGPAATLTALTMLAPPPAPPVGSGVRLKAKDAGPGAGTGRVLSWATWLHYRAEGGGQQGPKGGLGD